MRLDYVPVGRGPAGDTSVGSAAGISDMALRASETLALVWRPPREICSYRLFAAAGLLMTHPDRTSVSVQ